MSKRTGTEKREAIERLRAWIKPGDTVYTILRHVSRSGMFRRISVKSIKCAGKGKRPDIAHLDYNVAVALGISTRSIDDGVPMGGCGMDMGFALVYDLGHALYGDGYKCPGKGKCHSNEHSNPGERRDVYGRGVTHKDGYALAQAWL